MASRRARWAGQFYPAAADELERMVDAMLGSRLSDLSAWALIVPHAGYIYSGTTAGAAFARLNTSDVKRVILIGPSHHWPLAGFALTGMGEWSCPLGDIPLDTAAAETLLASGPTFAICEEAHSQEHSLEVQLPFILRLLPDVELLPIVMGHCDASNRGDALAALEKIASPGDLWLISTDLSHFHTRREAEKLDGELARILATGDATSFETALRSGTIEACGAGPLQLLLEENIRRGGAIEILHRCDSSDASGDISQVVGYLSAAFLKG
ncbi:MAG: AmmeMemoRadiSam system protein B [bacterium]|nr:AmmeMemoRadiSam system protein B [bacterium]